MLSRGAPRRSAEGAPSGYVGACVDINERRQVGDQLRESEALLDTIVQCAPVGFALLDLEMRYVRVNEALAEINGIEQEGHIGRRPTEILPDVPGELIETCFQRVLETGEQIADVEISGETPAAARRGAPLAGELVPGAQRRRDRRRGLLRHRHHRPDARGARNRAPGGGWRGAGRDARGG